MHRFRTATGRLLAQVRQWSRHDMLILAILAMVVGSATGGGVIIFREGIGLVQAVLLGSDTERLAMHAQDLPWWRVVGAPCLGGLVVGLLIYRLLPGRRPHGVADAIEASALKGGRMPASSGIVATVAAALSIGSGASVGGEGPAVHLGASLGSWIAARLHLTPTLSRTLLGCGAAAVVAASFNAPIAGALFANEVVIGHYALRAFAPVVMAAVMGTFVSRAYYGDYPAFAVIETTAVSIWEFPAFIGLGIAAGLAGLLLIRAVAVAQAAAKRLPVPAWMRPAVGGLVVGLMAVPVPHVLGIGYGVTEAALANAMPFWILVLVCVAKLAATAISLGFGFGGGVFSPSLVIGATLGGAFGLLAASVFPEMSAGSSAYTIVGMDAMAAAVLGAPISTTLVIFEMTGDYKLTIAVMLAVVVGTLVCRPLHGGSFFTWQLRQRGLDLHGGFEAALLRELPVGDVVVTACDVVGPEATLESVRSRLQGSVTGHLFVIDDDHRLIGTITLADLSEAAFDHDLDALINAVDVARRQPPMVTIEDDLGHALHVMRSSGDPHIAVVEDDEGRHFVGCLNERDAMAAYNRALLRVRREEQG